MADRKVLTQIASTAWEHPADRAALNSLRAIPGFDEVVRKIAGFFGEKGVRQLFLANAVLVGPKQRPRRSTGLNDPTCTSRKRRSSTPPRWGSTSRSSC